MPQGHPSNEAMEVGEREAECGRFGFWSRERTESERLTVYPRRQSGLGVGLLEAVDLSRIESSRESQSLQCVLELLHENTGSDDYLMLQRNSAISLT